MVIALLLVLVAGTGLLALARTLLVLLLVLGLIGLFVRTSATLRDAGVARIVGAALLTAGIGIVLVLLVARTLVVAGLLLACILTLARLLALAAILLVLLCLTLLRLILLSLAGLLLLTVVLLIGHVILLVIRSLEDAGGHDRRSVGEKPSCLQADADSIGAMRIPLWADIPAAVSGLLTKEGQNAIACLATIRNSPIGRALKDRYDVVIGAP